MSEIIISPCRSRQRKPKRARRFVFVVLLLLVAGWFIWPEGSSQSLVRDELTETEQAAENFFPDVPPEPLLAQEAPPPSTLVHDIEPGDSLIGIFTRFDLDCGALNRILEADEPLLALDILRPGNTLTFHLDEESRCLEEMELFIHPGNRVVYRRADDGSFTYEEIILPGNWQVDIVEGEISGSFYLSAINAGLSEKEAAQITRLFKEQIAFSRDIRAGDRFQVVRTLQFVDETFTGQSRIEGVRILRRNRVHSAFLCEDGNYYDQNGESLMRAFLRYPTAQRYRISSSFNPTRRHPVTRRVAPHNGTDFAMPTGTPVLSTGDGVVTRISNHPYAGKYIEIRHGGDYVTRYLHLHRILVNKGQSVKRGERIALSGNTGRSTGPHLHFELHVRGRPVNPMKADIPMTASVPRDRRTQFDQRVTELLDLMEGRREQIALR
jgi:murein DD-endopeptidase